MEFILGLLLSWPIFLTLLFATLLFEHKEEEYWVIFLLLLTAIIAFFMFDVSWTNLGLAAVAWLPIGFVYSFMKWKRHCTVTVQRMRDGKINAKEAEKGVAISNNGSKVAHWIIAWPFSLIDLIVGDIFDIIQGMCQGIFRRTYERVSAKALNEIKEAQTANVLRTGTSSGLTGGMSGTNTQSP